MWSGFNEKACGIHVTDDKWRKAVYFLFFYDMIYGTRIFMGQSGVYFTGMWTTVLLVDDSGQIIEIINIYSQQISTYRLHYTYVEYNKLSVLIYYCCKIAWLQL